MVVCLDVFLTLLALMVWPGGDINTVRQVQGATLTMSKASFTFDFKVIY